MQTSIQVYPIFPSTHASTRSNFLKWVTIKNMFLLWIKVYWKVFFGQSIIGSQGFLFLAVDYLEEWRINLKQTFVEENTCNRRKLNISCEELYWQKLCLWKFWRWSRYKNGNTRWCGKILKDFWKCGTFLRCGRSEKRWAKRVYAPRDAGRLANMVRELYIAIIVRRGYDVDYLFSIRLQKQCTNTFIGKIVWKMFMWIFYAVFGSFNYSGKVIVKGVSNIIGIAYSITIIKEQYSWYIGYYSFKRNKGLIPFHVFLILFQFITKYLS